MIKVKCNISGSAILYEPIYLANSFYSRLMGLMFVSPEKKYGILLVPGMSIHTCFMRYSLDVLFINAENKIIKILRNLKPWSFTWFYFSSHKVLELPSGSLPASVVVGQHVEINYV